MSDFENVTGRSGFKLEDRPLIMVFGISVGSVFRFMMGKGVRVHVGVRVRMMANA